MVKKAKQRKWKTKKVVLNKDSIPHKSMLGEKMFTCQSALFPHERVSKVLTTLSQLKFLILSIEVRGRFPMVQMSINCWFLLESHCECTGTIRRQACFEPIIYSARCYTLPCAVMQHLQAKLTEFSVWVMDHTALSFSDRTRVLPVLGE